jgi:hypothetical protein
MKKAYLATLAGVLGIGSTLGLGLVATVPAGAAQSTTTLKCTNGDTVTVRTNNNHSSDMGGWSAAQIVDGGSGHFIPVAFSFSVHNDTQNLTVTEPPSVKGSGNGNNHQATMQCSQSQTASLGDFLGGSAEDAPPGWNLTDTVTGTFTATVVAKP